MFRTLGKDFVERFADHLLRRAPRDAGHPIIPANDTAVAINHNQADVDSVKYRG